MRRGETRLGTSLFLFALLAALTAPCAAWTQGSSSALRRAVEVQDRHTEGFLGFHGVVGVATGHTRDGQPAIKVFVAEARHNWIPVGVTLEGVPVVVQVVGEIVARHHRPGHAGGPGGGEEPAPEPADPTARSPRPVPIGVSTGHPSITAGTIGCRVTDGTNVYALSNNHVYASENSASPGDNVLQPGTFDGGTDPADAIGTLSAFEAIVFSTLASNTIDAAIALSSTGDLGNATLPDGYGTPKSNTMAASINLKVKKYGRTTSETKGRVTAINATVNVGYDSGVARFVDQIIVEPGGFSAGGDSGSLIVVDARGKDSADDRRPVGLLFAGSPFITIANPIDMVLARFGVTIDGE